MGKFNLALPAKQGWKLINYSNSLISYALKAKYFPSTDFVNARLGNMPFYTWKSIWTAMGVLHEGLCWRVGSGAKISINKMLGF